MKGPGRLDRSQHTAFTDGGATTCKCIWVKNTADLQKVWQTGFLPHSSKTCNGHSFHVLMTCQKQIFMVRRGIKLSRMHAVCNTTYKFPLSVHFVITHATLLRLGACHCHIASEMLHMHALNIIYYTKAIAGFEWLQCNVQTFQQKAN